jgi:hypothetical protein
MTARRWAWELVNQWYVATESIRLLEAAVERYTELGRRDLAGFTELRLAGERGHDEFPLDDLSALGYDAEAVVRQVSPAAAAKALIAYGRAALRGDTPIELLGYIHAMERHVIRLSPAWFADLQRVLPDGVEAASGLRAHAGTLDTDHVEEAIGFFAGLPAEDRTTLAIGCYRTTRVRNAPTGGRDPSPAELEMSLAPLQVLDQPSNQGALP